MTTVTRFNVFTRPATDEADEHDVVRLFEKRKLVGEVPVEEVAREDFEADLQKFLTEAKDGSPLKAPRSLKAVQEWLEQEAPEGDEEEEVEDRGSIVPEKYRVLYGAAQNCGDEIATALTDYVTEPRKNKKNPDGGLDRAKLRGVAEVNGIGAKLADWEDRGLNGGLLRMNTSNVLRGMNRRGEQVTIGSQVWPAREVEKKPRKRSKKA